MTTENKENLLVKFPEEPSLGTPVETPINATPSGPDNPVDKAAAFLPRALSAIKENFKESVFLFIVVGYIFIAAFGHMERIDNYVGYFAVFLLSILIYKIWDKIKVRDILYILIIIILSSYLVIIKFNIPVLNRL